MNVPVPISYRFIQKAKPDIKIYIPVVNLRNARVQNKINNEIVAVLNKILIELGYFESSLVELLSYFEIKTNERNILSLSLITYSFTGGAHGMTIVKSLTFDTRTGESYTLASLFKADSNYIQKLSDLVGEKIKKWETPLLDEFKGIRPNQDFYLADHSIVLYFQLYEISPYVAGFPYFPIALWGLQDIIKPEGPLDRLLPFT
ncbi:DUF3298 and DUF4163 domain-containing protein [Chungangia koreensis]|uniref:DUF3298 and DUF4163 domain-containing protein n=1 Tax=Chungangia koreensis TaxID=752657 RepID=A0ABV8X4P6_9LACT